jgi:mono/diheme cytochrome c family protein
MMNDPKDPFYLSRGRLFLYGLITTAVLAALIWFYVPVAPQNVALQAPLQGPGSQTGLLAGVSPSSPASTDLSAESPEALYKRFCSQCHGDDGQGKTQMGAMMDGRMPNLMLDPPKVERTLEAISQLVRNGSANKVMPGFDKELGEAGARKVAEHVLQLPKPTPEPGAAP